MLGSDYPFPIGDLEPGRVIQQIHLDEQSKRQILGETARDVFSLPGSSGPAGD
jgi:aminocarboxymuconate-semialdehyde decarboxylase